MNNEPQIRIAPPDHELPDEWHYIHDFLHGFGFRRREKTLFFRDIERLLKDKLQEAEEAFRSLRAKQFAGQCEKLDAIYEQLQPLLEAEHAERMKNYKPVKFDKITIPKINRMYPPL